MAAQGEISAVAAVQSENEDGFYDDPRSDLKKKKFKPFQKMKNFFRGGSSKKRLKVEEGVGPKSVSTSALHNKVDDLEDDDDGGFRRKTGLAGSRSISEDSIFQPEQKEPPKIGVLQGQAVSMERINSGFQSELFTKLKSRQSDSDIDEGLPYSPIPMGTSSNMLFEVGRKSGTATGKSTSRESEKSLISVDGSDEDLFTSNWKSGVASVKTRSSSMDSLPDNLMEVTDFEAVASKSSVLSNTAAKHRISVKPQSRRLTSKMSMKKKERPAQAQLPDLKEESPSKSRHENTSDMKSQHKTVISTTISVGNPADTELNTIPRSEPREIPRSDARDISQSARRREDVEGSRPRSLSPLSTSPVSQSILQDVKLRPRPTSGKFDSVDVKKEPAKSGSELSQAFNKAKRFSKKYDEDGNVVDVSKSGVKEVDKDSDNKKPIATFKNVGLVKDELKSPTTTTIKDLTSTALSSTTATPTSPTSGVSFVLKKEPLRSGSKKLMENSGAGNSQTVETKEPVKTANVKEVNKDLKKTSSLSPTSSKNENDMSRSVSIESESHTKLNNSPKRSPAGSPEKLASPREDYRLKRQARSKTLPVSKEMVDKAEESEIVQRGLRLGSPPLSASRKTTPDYDNVIIGAKPIQSKRASWASASGTTAQSQGTEPSWIVKARLKQAEQNKKKDEDKTDSKTEVKVDVKNASQPNAAFALQKSEIQSTKSTKVGDKTVTAGDVKHPAAEKTQSSVRSWAQTHSAKPFEKTQSSVDKVSSVQTGSVKNVFEKPSVPSTKPSLSQSSSVKPPVSSQISSVKPAVSSHSSSVKSTVSSQSSSVVKPSGSSQASSVKPTVSSATKPSVDKTVASSTNKLASNKQLSQSVRPSFDGKASQFGAKPGGFDRSFSQKAGSGFTKSAVDLSKPASQTSSSRPLGSVNTNVAKTDTKEPAKTLSQETKKVEIESKKDTNSSLPAWKQALNQKKNSTQPQPVKIEIIDKNKDKTVEKKVDEKTTIQQRDKPKTAPEKCSDLAGNRSSKVLDMVKSFQKLQVT